MNEGNEIKKCKYRDSFQCLDLILKSKEGKNTIDTDIDMIQARDIFKTC